MFDTLTDSLTSSRVKCQSRWSWFCRMEFQGAKESFLDETNLTKEKTTCQKYVVDESIMFLKETTLNYTGGCFFDCKIPARAESHPLGAVKSGFYCFKVRPSLRPCTLCSGSTPTETDQYADPNILEPVNNGVLAPVSSQSFSDLVFKCHNWRDRFAVQFNPCQGPPWRVRPFGFLWSWSSWSSWTDPTSRDHLVRLHPKGATAVANLRRSACHPGGWPLAKHTPKQGAGS